MDIHIVAIVLQIVLYLLFILLPLVPSVVIYKLFPKTNVGLSGPLHGLTINASGAFAAYVITAILGYFLVSNALFLINTLVFPRWQVVAEVQLHDPNNERYAEVTERQLIQDLLEVTTIPPLLRTSRNSVRMEISSKLDELPQLLFSIKGFYAERFDLRDEKVRTIDKRTRTIKLTLVGLTQKSEETHRQPRIDESLRNDLLTLIPNDRGN